jgi:hypothetical protein
MKRLLTLAITMFMGASLALAQTTGDKGKTAPPGKVAPKTSTTTAPKNHKGGKKGNKGGKKTAGGTTTPNPK